MCTEFEALVNRYSRLMAAAIRRVCGSRYASLIPDAEQEMRLALWKRLRSGKKIDHPSSYLYRAALNTALAVVRKAAPELSLDDEETRHEPPVPEHCDHNLAPAERRVLIDQALARLPKDQARALRAYLAGCNHSEVAVLFGWTESQARHRIYRGRLALGEVLMG